MELAPDGVGRRHLKNHLPEVMRTYTERGVAVAITNRGRVDGYLMPAGAVEELDRARRLREAIPLLMSAAAAGAAVPSRTLRELGIEIPFDWRALNRFTAGAEITFTEGADGEPWVAQPDAIPEIVEEDDADFEP